MTTLARGSKWQKLNSGKKSLCKWISKDALQTPDSHKLAQDLQCAVD
jgi:hypothetical protein